MGYSNNKWRKILTILIIINLCFILFAKITKASAVDIEVPVLNETIYIDESLNDYNFLLFFRPVGAYNEFYATILITEKTRDFLLRPDNSSNRDLIYMSSKGSYYTHTYRGSVAQLKTTFATFTSSSFTLNSTSLDGSPSLIGTFTGVSSIYTTDDFYTNSPIYNYSNSSSVIVEPNVVFFNPPYFQNSSEIEAGYPDGVYISIQDYDKNENLYFHLLQVDSESVPTPGNSVFYYSDNMFQLNKNSSYYKSFEGDEDENLSYYYIPRYELSFNLNTSYVYVLTSSPDPINNSYNHIEKDIENGIYDVIESDTTGVMTSTDLESDRLNRIEQETVNQANNTNSINNSLTNTNTDLSSEQEISDNLNFNNNSGLDNLNQGFFSRLTSLLNTIVDYNLEEIDSINLPIPFTNQNITLYSNMVSAHLPEALTTIIQAFWLFLFNFYLFKFINKIYIAFSTGNILSGLSSSDEAITNSML